MTRFDRIYIEISNICNLQCSFCPEVLRPKKWMAPERFTEVLAKVRPHTDAITLHVMGEPLAHPKFVEILKAVEAAQIPLILTSNGQLIERHQEVLLTNPLIKQVNFSVHSFHDNFPTGDAFRYLEKITLFSRQFIATHPDAFVNFRLWDFPEDESPDGASSSPFNLRLFEFFRQLFAEPEIPDRLNVRERKSYRLERHIKLHFDTRFEWPSLNHPLTYGDGFCYGLKSQLAILTEGTVVPCCLDKEGVINLGSIFEKDLSTIISGDRAQRVLAGFSRHKAVEPLCQKCQFKTRFS